MATKQLKIKKIVANNKSVDARQFAEATRLVEQLRAQGAASPAYNLASPFDQQVTAVEPIALVIGQHLNNS